MAFRYHCTLTMQPYMHVDLNFTCTHGNIPREEKSPEITDQSQLSTLSYITPIYAFRAVEVW